MSKPQRVASAFVGLLALRPLSTPPRAVNSVPLPESLSLMTKRQCCVSWRQGFASKATRSGWPVTAIRRSSSTNGTLNQLARRSHRRLRDRWIETSGKECERCWC